MRAEDVLGELRKQPFVPLLLRLSNGAEYVVKHPDQVLVGRSFLNIGIPAPDLPAGVHEGYETVNLLHLVQIIPQLVGSAKPPLNGPAA